MQFWAYAIAFLFLTSSPVGMPGARAQEARSSEAPTVYECIADGMRQFVMEPIPGAKCRVFPVSVGQASDADAVILGRGAPTILPQCIDSGPHRLGVGPSARARECTRQYCERKDYRNKVTTYAMKQQQSSGDAELALICIMRSEADMKR